MNQAIETDTTITKLREGFERLALILRADMWAVATTQELNPTQVQVLLLLANRQNGLRTKDIAQHLAVSAASITETLNALTRKGLITRNTDPADARATILKLSGAGKQSAHALDLASSHISKALASLSITQRTELLTTQIHLIRQLQSAGVIPLQHMCVSCQYFQPNRQANSLKPHHCAFINADIGNIELQLDCPDHAQADAQQSTALWARFMASSASQISGAAMIPDTEIPVL